MCQNEAHGSEGAREVERSLELQGVLYITTGTHTPLQKHTGRFTSPDYMLRFVHIH